MNSCSIAYQKCKLRGTIIIPWSIRSQIDDGIWNELTFLRASGFEFPYLTAHGLNHRLTRWRSAVTKHGHGTPYLLEKNLEP